MEYSDILIGDHITFTSSMRDGIIMEGMVICKEPEAPLAEYDYVPSNIAVITDEKVRGGDLGFMGTNRIKTILATSIVPMSDIQAARDDYRFTWTHVSRIKSVVHPMKVYKKGLRHRLRNLL